MPETQYSSEAGGNRGSKRGLVVCAAILGVLVCAQLLGSAPPFGGGSNGGGGMVSQRGSHTIMTADAGSDDVVLVLDGRNEQLFVYRTNQQTGMQLLQKLNLPTVFADARIRNAGK